MLLQLISVSALALMIGISAAAAQGGSARQTEHGIEKKKDSELLTPIRPLPRKVGETSWPEAKPEAQREANDRKAAPPRETTGQSMSAQSNKADQPNNTAANNRRTPQPAQNNQAATNQPQPAQNAQPQPPRRTTPRRPRSLRKTPRRMRLRLITRSPISRMPSSRHHKTIRSRPRTMRSRIMPASGSAPMRAARSRSTRTRSSNSPRRCAAPGRSR